MIEDMLTNKCNFSSVKPALVALPYPEIKVKERNKAYADLLALDYCGQSSEMTSTMQYINHEGRMSGNKCEIAQIILGIAMAEMIHLQKLGELICLLGGTLDFTTKNSTGRQVMWSPSNVKIGGDIRNMLWADIEGERIAINQYRRHMNLIKDKNINQIMARIIKDEEYHIMLLRALLDK